MKQGRIIVLCIALMLIIVSPVMAVPIDDQLTKIRIVMEQTEELEQGKTFQVEVVAYDARDLYGVQFLLHYDPAVLQLTNNDSAVSISEQFTPYGSSTDLENGVISLPLIYNDPPYEYKEELLLATFTFEAVQTGVTSLSLSDVIGVNRSLFEIQDRGQDEVSITVGEMTLVPLTVQLVSADGVQLQGESVSARTISAVGERGIFEAVTDDAGLAHFLLPQGTWQVQLQDEYGIVQTGLVTVERSENDEQSEPVTLPIAPLQAEERQSQPFSLIDAYAFAQQMQLHGWDLNFDGVTDDRDAAQLLEKVEPVFILDSPFAD